MRFISIILIFVIFFYHYDIAFATNTHSTQLTLSSSQFWSITDASQTGLDITGDMTIEAWFYLDSAQSGNYRTIVSKHDNASNISYMLTLTSTNGEVFFGTSANGSTQLYDKIDTGSFNTSQWYHIAVAYDASAGTAELYLDTVSQGTFTGLATSLYNGSEPFRIGARGPTASPTDFFDGRIDDVRVWNDIRTSTEIADNYNCQLVGNETNLQGYWQFNNDGTDETSNGNNLTNNNSATFSTGLPFTAECGAVATPSQEDLILFE